MNQSIEQQKIIARIANRITDRLFGEGKCLKAETWGSASEVAAQLVDHKAARVAHFVVEQINGKVVVTQVDEQPSDTDLLHIGDLSVFTQVYSG